MNRELPEEWGDPKRQAAPKEPGFAEKVRDPAAEIERLRGQVVWGFYEEEYPNYKQGREGEHELTEPITADEANDLIGEIKRLKAELAEMREALDRLTQAVGAFTIGDDNGGNPCVCPTPDEGRTVQFELNTARALLAEIDGEDQ